MADRFDQSNNNTSHRGFASMTEERVREIAKQGGQASAQQAGHEGMAARGKMGGEARKEELGHDGYSQLGKEGGKASAAKAGHEGMAERGREGGKASGKSRREKAEHEPA